MEDFGRVIARGTDEKRRVRRRQREIAKAAARTNLQAAAKLTRLVDGRPQFVRQPPVLERLEDVLPDDQGRELEHDLAELVASYGETLLPERRALLRQFQVTDVARKVVGVGSVGTRC